MGFPPRRQVAQTRPGMSTTAKWVLAIIFGFIALMVYFASQAMMG
jgi:hypothetical protein